VTTQPIVREFEADLTVVSAVEAAEDVVALTLAAADGAALPPWTPGAHVDLVLGEDLVRQYSLCGSTAESSTWRIAVLRAPDSRGGSKAVHAELREGATVRVRGPRNHFPMVASPRYLFIAGGIGITPMLPMIADAEASGADWRLVYGGRSRSSMAFLDELAPYGDRVVVHAKDELGPLDLAGFLGEPAEGTRIYCCGPSRLLAAMETACAGLPPYTLRTERFVAEEQGAPARTAPFQVELARTGTTVTVTPDVSVLEAVGSAGIEVLSSCRQGICGTCETGVLAGRPDHRDSLLDRTDAHAGVMLDLRLRRPDDIGQRHRLIAFPGDIRTAQDEQATVDARHSRGEVVEFVQFSEAGRIDLVPFDHVYRGQHRVDEPLLPLRELDEDLRGAGPHHGLFAGNPESLALQGRQRAAEVGDRVVAGDGELGC